MFLELVGLPGAGKTTLAERLDGMRCGDRVIERVAIPQERLLRLLRTEPRATLRALWRLLPSAILALLQRHSGQGIRGRLAPVPSLVNAAVLFDRLRSQSRGRLFLFDEFVGQRAVGFFAATGCRPKRARVERFLRAFRDYPSLRLQLRLPPEIAEARARERSEEFPRRLAGLTVQRRRRAYAEQARMLEWMSEEPGSLCLDASLPLEALERAARSAIETCTEPALRVAHFAFNFSLYSGAARQAQGLIRQFQRRGDVASVVVSVERRARAEWGSLDCGVPVLRLPPGVLRNLKPVRRFLSLHRIEVMHLHGLVGVGLAVSLLGRKPAVWKTTLLGSDDLSALRHRRFGGWLVAALSRLSANAVPSVALERENSRHLPADRIHRIPNGVEPGDEPAARQNPIFCCVGAVCERKRTHLAIERFLADYANDEEATLYVVGPGYGEQGVAEGDPRYAERCRSLVDPDRADRVIFTGMLPPESLAALYAECLGFLSFSASEGMPNALLEAMASNCVPIVGEMAGVASEVLGQPPAGFILGADEPLPPLDQVRQMSAQGLAHKRVREHFGFESVAARVRQLYDALLASGAPR